MELELDLELDLDLELGEVSRTAIRLRKQADLIESSGA